MKPFLLKLWHRWWFSLIAALIAIGICLNGYVAMRLAQQKTLDSSQPPPIYTVRANQPRNFSRNSPPTSNHQATLTNTAPLLGHSPHQEGDLSKMIPVGSYAQGKDQRLERLMPDATLALMKLIYAARDEGIWIIPVSCFRNLEDQQKLFIAQIQRRGSQEAAAKASAPPGYSEHHTGYALDLADGRFPKQDISLEFAKTEAFMWMQLHAKEFGFELSFPENNPQGVNYEPWRHCVAKR